MWIQTDSFAINLKNSRAIFLERGSDSLVRPYQVKINIDRDKICIKIFKTALEAEKLFKEILHDINQEEDIIIIQD